MPVDGRRRARPGRGFGLLSRQFGLTVDYLHAVEVVDEDRGGDEDPFAALFAILTHKSKEKIGLIAQIDADVPGAPDRVWDPHDVFRHRQSVRG